MWITNVRLPGSIELYSVQIIDEKIAQIHQGIIENEADQTIFDGNGHHLCPGFIDLHFHGALGHDLLELVPEQWNDICHFLATHGVTSVLATACSTSYSIVDSFLEIVRQFMQRNTPNAARVIGAHLEGPFLNPKYAGMQPISTLRLPKDCPESWIDGDVVKRMTVALEMEGGPELLKRCNNEGILLSLGHSDATADQVSDWTANLGLSHATHVFNAMSRAEKRDNEPVRRCGVVEGALASDIIVELILDGAHVPEYLFKMAYKCKGGRNITIATDSTPLTGLDQVEGKIMQYGGNDESVPKCTCVFRNGICVSPDTGALVGSVTPLGDMFPRVLKWVDGDWETACRLCSTNAAELIGAQNIGHVKRGYDADLVLVDDEGIVESVWVKGSLEAM